MQVRSMAWNEVMQLRQLSRSPSQNRQPHQDPHSFRKGKWGSAGKKERKKVLEEYKEKSEWK